MYLEALLYSQCQAEVNVATRTSAIVQWGIQRIQQNAPLIRSCLETSQIAFQKAKAGYKFFQRIKEIIKKKKEDNDLKLPKSPIWRP